MNINSILVDSNNNKIETNTLIHNAKNDKKDGIDVVYAHIAVVNDNGFSLRENSITTTRERYPLLFEHSDLRVEDVVGYIETDAKPNEKGEFIGTMYFYNTEQGQHAKQLWLDEVINELSVSYYLDEFDVVDDGTGNVFLDVKNCILKEVSIVSVGADRATGEAVSDVTTEDDKTEIAEVATNAREESDSYNVQELSENSDNLPESESEEDVEGSEVETEEVEPEGETEDIEPGVVTEEVVEESEEVTTEQETEKSEVNSENPTEIVENSENIEDLKKNILKDVAILLTL
jgi:caudovirus prohead protease|nr:MAG TPA: prohead serine protease [Caudoviricetes sp.]